MTSARIAVNLAVPGTAREDRDKLTEWVNVAAFTKRSRDRLEQASKGDTIAVLGTVSKHFYQHRDGERRIERAIFADDVMIADTAIASKGPGQSGPAPANAYPRGLHGTYRGRLVRDPRTIERDGKPSMTTARIAVNLCAPTTPREEREDLTEWVDVIAFSERGRHLLEQTRKGDLVEVTGGVSKQFYAGRDGRRGEDRTMIAEDVVSVRGSLQAGGTHPADIDTNIKDAIGTMVPDDETKPTRVEPDTDLD